MNHLRSARRFAARAVVSAALVVWTVAGAAAQSPITYRVSFPAPEHHYAAVEVTFTAVAAVTLEARMSRSSPGRYAIHEFAKNVFELQAYSGAGSPLAVTRPNPYQWNIAGHDGTVRILYRIYGDHVDGTYLGIDPTHAHMNIPATLMWARGFEARPVRVTFVPPAGRSWTPATQLFPTDDPWTFTAPNMQYLMDSPTELSNQTIRSFTVTNPDGKEFTIRVALHHDAGDAEVDEYVAATEKIVKEQGAIFGEYPEYETGTYTFLGDYVPWGGGDGMEHRNSTVVAQAISLRTPGAVSRILGTVSHEFFHAWNVERIRPRSLEPFDFEGANMSDALWLAEGFTQYYGGLTLVRVGLTPEARGVAGMAGAAAAVLNEPGRRFRSAAEMSLMAPFVDAARSVDRTNFSTTFISYYTHGAALALALDLSLRHRSNGKITLDDYMRALWRAHGRPGGPAPGLVAKPYTMKDARDRLAEVAGDRAFADAFFDRYIEGRDAPDFATLFGQAGFVFRKRNPGAGWIGTVNVDGNGTIVSLVDWGSPAWDAGLDQGDTLIEVDGKPLTGGNNGLQAAVRSRQPGESISVAFRRRGGDTGTASITVQENPDHEAVPVESAGGTLTPAQKRFRAGWLGSNVRP